MDDFVPRAGQSRVLSYTGGKMAISAVPGSGKTRTLAELAARLVAEEIGQGQEVLVVTLANSAVDNFKGRINTSIRKRGLLAGYGYRVRTLHGLAHDIVRERPGLVGLAEDFGIIDERDADAVRDAAVDMWLRIHPDAADPYLARDPQSQSAEWIKRTRWPAEVRSLIAAFIKRAKDLQLTPAQLQESLAQVAAASPAVGELPAFGLVHMGASIYADYQHGLSYRGVVDFDDLIRLALEALRSDDAFLERLHRRWPYVLEDEAQDSSRLQEQILRLLAGPAGNWVRVGDPNQAIYETFTTADPKLLREFTRGADVLSLELPESGRSQQAIIDLANALIKWVMFEHPTADVRHALQPPSICPTAGSDPQPNPPADPAAVWLSEADLTPEGELLAVAASAARWAEEQAARPDDQQQTCAVLVPRNQRGFELIDLLKSRGTPYVELLRSTSATRQTAGSLGYLLRCLADPLSPRKLSMAFRVWRRDDRQEAEAKGRVQAVAEHIGRSGAVEAYLWPRADVDWLAGLLPTLPDDELDLLEAFRLVACRWHRAASLPVDQLVLTLAGDVLHEPAELALAHKLALLLREIAEAHPSYRLPELVEELATIARNERRFLGFAGDDRGFEPPRGKVTVATMHKAKGLEWDRVYLMSVNNYDFPSGQSHDIYISERWFVRDQLNLQAEAQDLLEAIAHSSIEHAVEPSDAPIDLPPEGRATRQARLDYVVERLRLLYVGITRARRELIVTWNRGRRRGELLRPAAALSALTAQMGDDLRLDGQDSLPR